jgi:hypothetical protein
LLQDKKKGKAIHVLARTGPEGTRKLKPCQRTAYVQWDTLRLIKKGYVLATLINAG